MTIICVNYICQIRHIRNDKYKWIQVDTIYNLLAIIILLHILHIRSSDICGTQNETMTKHFCDKHCKQIGIIFN